MRRVSKASGSTCSTLAKARSIARWSRPLYRAIPSRTTSRRCCCACASCPNSAWRHFQDARRERRRLAGLLEHVLDFRSAGAAAGQPLRAAGRRSLGPRYRWRRDAGRHVRAHLRVRHCRARSDAAEAARHRAVPRRQIELRHQDRARGQRHRRLCRTAGAVGVPPPPRRTGLCRVRPPPGDPPGGRPRQRRRALPQLPAATVERPARRRGWLARRRHRRALLAGRPRLALALPGREAHRRVASRAALRCVDLCRRRRDNRRQRHQSSDHAGDPPVHLPHLDLADPRRSSRGVPGRRRARRDLRLRRRLPRLRRPSAAPHA